MAHTVEIDLDALARERAHLEHLAGAVGGEGCGAGLPAVADPYQEWYDAAVMGLEMLHGGVCPEWQITEKGRHLMARGIASYGAKYFPDGPLMVDFENAPGWLQIAAGAGFIAAANFDFAELRLRPMKLEPEPARATDPTRGPVTQQPAQPEQEGGDLAKFPV